MKTLKDILEPTLTAHRDLVSSGISSEQALNIAISPLVTNNLHQSLSQLTVDQMDKLLRIFKDNPLCMPEISGLPDVADLSGITIEKGTYLFHFTGLDGDYFIFQEHDLWNGLIDELLKQIRNVL